MTAADKQEIGLLKNYIASILPNMLDFCFNVVLAVIVYLIGSRIIKAILKMNKRWADRKEIDEGVKQFIHAFIKGALYVLLIFIILTLFGVTTASVVAVLGSAGLTLGLALQGSLSNFAGGVMILLMKPFKVGDYVIEDTNKNEGTVEEISLFYTRLKTIDNKSIVIPNGTLANNSMTNVTAAEKRRLDLTVGISYQADIRQAKEVLNQVILNEPACLLEEETKVFVSELADSCVIMGIRIWVKTEDYWDAKWRMNENIKVYRSANHANSSCIGTGKLSRVDPQGVTATGYVLAAYVEDGQHVSRGDVLFDVVPDVLDGMVGGDGHVYMPEDGVLLSVSAVSGEQAAKDAVLATYCPKDAMRLVCSVDEQDLSELAVGDVMQVTLDAYEDKPLSGTIVKIASASGDDGTSTSFDVTIELEANDLMRIGMSASAER